jgi:hypothetical protein
VPVEPQLTDEPPHRPPVKADHTHTASAGDERRYRRLQPIHAAQGEEPHGAQVDDHRGSCACVNLVNRLDERQPGIGIQVDLAVDADEDVARWLVRDFDPSHPCPPIHVVPACRAVGPGSSLPAASKPLRGGQ